MESVLSASKRGLPPDIILIILEEICTQNPLQLPTLRLVSRTFDKFAVNLQYRSIVLDDSRVAAAFDAETQIAKHIKTNARCLLIDGSRNVGRNTLVERLMNFTNVHSLM